MPLALHSIQPHSCSAPALERQQASSAGGLGGDSSSAWVHALPVPCVL